MPISLRWAIFNVTNGSSWSTPSGLMIRTVPLVTSLKKRLPSGANRIDIGSSTPSRTVVILMSGAMAATGVGVLCSFVSGVSTRRGVGVTVAGRLRSDVALLSGLLAAGVGEI